MIGWRDFPTRFVGADSGGFMAQAEYLGEDGRPVANGSVDGRRIIITYGRTAAIAEQRRDREKPYA